MFVLKDFTRRREEMCEFRAHFGAMKRCQTKSFGTNIGTIPENMPTNFEPKRLKPKLDIVEKPRKSFTNMRRATSGTLFV